MTANFKGALIIGLTLILACFQPIGIGLGDGNIYRLQSLHMPNHSIKYSFEKEEVTCLGKVVAEDSKFVICLKLSKKHHVGGEKDLHY